MVLNKCRVILFNYFNHRLSFSEIHFNVSSRNRKKKNDNTVIILQSLSDYYDLSQRPEITIEFRIIFRTIKEWKFISLKTQGLGSSLFPFPFIGKLHLITCIQQICQAPLRSKQSMQNKTNTTQGTQILVETKTQRVGKQGTYKTPNEDQREPE